MRYNYSARGGAEHISAPIPLSDGNTEPVTNQVKFIGCHVITTHDAILKSTAVNSNSDWTFMYNITQKYLECPSTTLLRIT